MAPCSLERTELTFFFYEEFLIQQFSCSADNLNFHSLFAQYNEHRIFFPRLLYYAVAKFTNGNSMAVLYTSLGLMTVAYLLIIHHVNTKLPEKTAFFAPIIVGALIYSPKQHENILWGFQLAFCMTYVFSILSIYCFSRHLERKDDGGKPLLLYAAAVLCAVIASFSSIQGLVVWWVVAVVWVMAEKTALARKPQFHLWLIAAAASTILYFNDYQGPSNLSYYSNYFVDVKAFIMFFLILTGQVLVEPAQNFEALLVGILATAAGLFIFIDYLRCKRIRDLFSISLIVYGAAVCVGITLGRSGGGLFLSHNSRYLTFVYPIYIGICLYCFFRLKEELQSAAGEQFSRTRDEPAAPHPGSGSARPLQDPAVPKKTFALQSARLASIAIPLAILVTMFASTGPSFEQSRQWRKDGLYYRAILCDYEKASTEELRYLLPLLPYINNRDMLAGMKLLKEKSFGAFHECGRTNRREP